MSNTNEATGPPLPTLIHWGVINDEVRFVPDGHAQHLAALHHAVLTATTWGEFQAMVGSEDYERARAIILGDDEEDGSDFCMETLVENDFPSYAAKDMAAWMPKSIVERFGVWGESFISGDLLTFKVEDAPAIIAALEAVGCVCRTNQRLVERAEGYD